MTVKDGQDDRKKNGSVVVVAVVVAGGECAVNRDAGEVVVAGGDAVRIWRIWRTAGAVWSRDLFLHSR